jgi:hypothetical protein
MTRFLAVFLFVCATWAGDFNEKKGPQVYTIKTAGINLPATYATVYGEKEGPKAQRRHIFGCDPQKARRELLEKLETLGNDPDKVAALDILLSMFKNFSISRSFASLVRNAD